MVFSKSVLPRNRKVTTDFLGGGVGIKPPDPITTAETSVVFKLKITAGAVLENINLHLPVTTIPVECALRRSEFSRVGSTML